MTIRVSDTGIGIPRDRQHGRVRALRAGGVGHDAPLRRQRPGPRAVPRDGRSRWTGISAWRASHRWGSVFEVVLPWPTQVRACEATLADRRILTLIADPVERKVAVGAAAPARRAGPRRCDARRCRAAARRGCSASTPCSSMRGYPTATGSSCSSALADRLPAAVHRIVLLADEPPRRRSVELRGDRRGPAVQAGALCRARARAARGTPGASRKRPASPRRRSSAARSCSPRTPRRTA